MATESPSVDSIFFAAMDKPSAVERAAYLDEVCGKDTELRRRVDRLLSAQSKVANFLESPAADLPSPLGGEGPGVRGVATIDEPRVTEGPGTVIGPYKLLEQIGEGGFGVVFMAEQTQPVRRKVALKVLKPGMDTRQVVARFEAERQALAIMDHPNIARVFDGGATASGRPYFVMELVKGVPITEHCDQNHLTPRERLELFVSVCHAVQHAHQKGIIHRDLKPSNVLVTMHDATPVVKVIDFGVAKALGQELTDKTLFTAFAQMIGTPLYMSPEQAGQSALDVDTRSDIYSLGVLLYELLTGTTPFHRDRFRQAAYDEIRRIIIEEEPPKPSTRLSELGKSSPHAPRAESGVRSVPTTVQCSLASVAAQRHTDPVKLPKLVRGELDWIVMKCLEKDRNRRYETANGMAMDIARYLNDEAVTACPPSAGYRLRKFARRNRVALSTASLVAAALVLGTVVSIWQAVRATHARHEAEVARTEEAAQRAVADQRRVEAEEQRTEAERQREQAEDARKQAIANLQKAREAVDTMLTRVAEEKLFDAPQMEPVRKALLQDALEFYKGFLDEASTDPALRLETSNAYSRIGRIQHLLGQFSEADIAFHQCIELLKKLMDETPADSNFRAALVRSHGGLGWSLVYQERFEEAANAYRNALSLLENLDSESVGEYRQDLITVRVQLARILLYTSRHRDAEEALLEALPSQEQISAEIPTDVWRLHSLATIHELLGDVQMNIGQPVDAARSFRKALQIEENVVANPHSDKMLRHVRALYKFKLANSLRANSRLQEAERLFRESIAEHTVLVVEHPDVSDYLLMLGDEHLHFGLLLESDNRLQEAEQAYRRASELCAKVVAQSPGRPLAWTRFSESRQHLVSLLKQSRQADEAEKVCCESIVLVEKLVADFPSKPGCRWDLARQHRALGDLLRDSGRLNDAQKAYQKAIAQCDKTVAELAAQRDEGASIGDAGNSVQSLKRSQAETLSALGELAIDLGDSKRALEYFARAIELDPQNVDAFHRRALVYNRIGEHHRALADADRAVQLDPNHHASLIRRANTYSDLKEYDKALADFAKAERNVVNPFYVHSDRAALHISRGAYVEALKDLDRAIEIQPKNSYVYKRRALALFHLEQFDKAIADVRTALELTPHDTSALVWIPPAVAAACPDAAFREGLLELAAGAVEKSNDPARARSDRAALYLALNEMDKARADLETLTASDAARYSDFYYYASLALEHDDAAKYRALCQTMLQKFGATEDPMTANFTAWTAALALGSLDDYGPAIALATKAVESQPKSDQFFNTLGAVLYRAGRHQEAVDKLTELDRRWGDAPLDGNHSPAYTWYFLAMAHHRLGNGEAPATWLKKANEWKDKVLADKVKPPAWNRKITLELLRREAGELIGVKKDE